MARLSGWLLLVILCLAACALSAAAADPPAAPPAAAPPVTAPQPLQPPPTPAALGQAAKEAKAILDISRSGGAVKRDDESPGHPVIEAHFWGDNATDAALANIAVFPHLRQVGVYGGAITDAGLRALKACPGLQGLIISTCHITDAGIKEFLHLQYIKQLDLGDTPITDAGLKDLGGLTSLERLDLNFTDVSDAGLKDLAPLKNLKELYLYGTLVTEAGAKAAEKAMTGLRIHVLDKPGLATSLSMYAGGMINGSSHADKAKEFLRRAIEADPNCALAHNNLGVMIPMSPATDPDAIAHFRRAVEIDPNYAEAHNNLAARLTGPNQQDEAIRHLREAIRISPDYVAAHFNLGLMLTYQGKTDAAIAEYEATLKIHPDYVPALANLALARATAADPNLRKGAEAARLAERACQLTERKNAACLDTLAAAYAEAGRFPDAVQTAEEALKLAQSNKDTTLTAEIQAALELYQAGKPNRVEPPKKP